MWNRQTFAVGLSTNLTVIQYQNYLAQARSTEVAFQGRLRQSEDRAWIGLLAQRSSPTVLRLTTPIGQRHSPP